MNARARDARIARALDTVLSTYTIVELQAEPDGRRRFLLSNGRSAPSTVTVTPDWSSDVQCSCPDAARTHTVCKHAIAVLYRDPELRGQLLDLFLR